MTQLVKALGYAVLLLALGGELYSWIIGNESPDILSPLGVVGALAFGILMLVGVALVELGSKSP